MKLTNLTINQIHEGLKNKEFTALELANAFFGKIEKEDKRISAFLTQTRDLALLQAKEVDDKILQKREIPLLAGIPMAVKDNILVENVKCTAGSKILANYIAPYDATVIKKLKDKDAVILGKTNLDEFAMGSSTENSGFFTTKNPRDLTRVPGGSSGGSAAAVAANLSVFALGSDTGGSIRQPASFCGVVGLKPTYGAVSRYGLIAFASSLDQIGPITKTVEDCRIVFEAISGRDEMDSTSIGINHKLEIRNPKKIPNSLNTKYYKKRSNWFQFKIQNLRIGIPKEYFTIGTDAEVEQAIKSAINKFEDLGAKIEEVSLPHTEYALSSYYIIAPAEASANLARYDGIKYGYSAEKADDLMAVYFDSREKGFGSEVRRRIMLGTYALSSGYYDAFYLKAQKARTLIKEDFENAFKRVDLIFTPVSPTPAFKIGEKISDPLTMYLSDIFTIAVNLAGLPAISIPCPVRNLGKQKTEKDFNLSIDQKGISNGACGKMKNLPVGLQIIGKPFQEHRILEAGEVFEKNNP